ncbi:nucleotidyltransferase family protein [[Mycobacterium] burgundiense]|uniref:Nucleotidyltransferase domain-containing protein n=1 Tax=[Mycobacterium] burgundiense TaxID=3064286 RepID=A0ABM9LLU0_9MYCO|nr:nucleotidyltransferase domain-containing protein [Mycolicibacterium sp. MU0053]CAJ1501243.1 nucleotidyltransferase domain-containing protein [Mycolicibacterium sp. MU0053]
MTSAYSRRALETVQRHREAICAVLTKYGASNPRLFGSVAQGNAGPDSDVDILLDLSDVGPGSRLARLSGIRLELEELLQMRIDVADERLLKAGVSETARQQAIAL